VQIYFDFSWDKKMLFKGEKNLQKPRDVIY